MSSVDHMTMSLEKCLHYSQPSWSVVMLIVEGTDHHSQRKLVELRILGRYNPSLPTATANVASSQVHYSPQAVC